MKWRRLLSLRRWSHVLKKVSGYLTSPRVEMRDKLLFVIPAALYWVLPDLMPFVPIDDIGVTMLLMNFFVGRVERKYPELALRKQPVRNTIKH
ncbi:hypothetical protein [Paenibacillus lemnae]|uniref:DUF1232 domain-containing protein n=1 Tax=Paenibacillus lemnae TaxID=1330551 RepID=A0A848M3A4_PAELE|nr:hypothetical protein [Paenibacillus lemnae]NMO95407.1 hypothetical protein [Paenibacillus lemnae]